jgi:hypothetical protein
LIKYKYPEFVLQHSQKIKDYINLKEEQYSVDEEDSPPIKHCQQEVVNSTKVKPHHRNIDWYWIHKEIQGKVHV